MKCGRGSIVVGKDNDAARRRAAKVLATLPATVKSQTKLRT